MTPGFLVFEIYELVGLVLLGTPNGVPAPRSWTFLDEGGPSIISNNIIINILLYYLTQYIVPILGKAGASVVTCPRAT